MFRMKKKRSYRVFEGLRVATLVSYMGASLMPIPLQYSRRSICKYPDRQSPLFGHSPC